MKGKTHLYGTMNKLKSTIFQHIETFDMIFNTTSYSYHATLAGNDNPRLMFNIGVKRNEGADRSPASAQLRAAASGRGRQSAS